MDWLRTALSLMYRACQSTIATVAHIAAHRAFRRADLCEGAYACTLSKIWAVLLFVVLDGRAGRTIIRPV
jgi:hypothetical protein